MTFKRKKEGNFVITTISLVRHWHCHFGLKDAKLGGPTNLYLTKNQFGRKEICYAEDNHNYMSNTYEKEFSDSNFN